MMNVLAEELERLRLENARLRHDVSALRPQAELAQGLADAVILTDPDFNIRFWNEAAAQAYGYAVDEVVGRPLAQVVETEFIGRERQEVVHEVRTRGRWRGEVRQRHRDGHRVAFDCIVSAMHDAQGTLLGFVGVNRDITGQVAEREHRRREAKRAIQLAELAHDLAAEANSLRGVLETCARGVGRFLEDAVTIALRPTDGPAPAAPAVPAVPEPEVLEVVTHYDDDPVRRLAGRALYDGTSLRVGEGVAGRVVATGEPLVRFADTPEGIATLFADDTFRDAARSFTAFAIASVPLTAQGRVIGAMTCIRFRPGAPHDADDLRFLRNLAGHAALAVANARLHDEGHHTQETLRGRTRELELAVSELESFAYSVSHDVRAPLRSIEGLAQLIEDELAATLPPEPRDWLRRLRGATVHLTELVDALLALSRVSRWRLSVSPVDLSGVAEDVVAEVRTRDPQRTVDVRITPGMLVEADPVLLRIALMNLIENAWKFTGRLPDARLEVGRLFDADGQVVHFVRDNGAGFDPAYAGRLFQPFERLHRAEDFPGTGIGLATVSRVVRRHGGAVWADASPGRGATLYFTLGSPRPAAGG